MAAKKLSPKQLQFCKEYIVDLNATQAAIRAGYSKKTARQKAHNLFTIVYILEEVERLQSKRDEQTELTAEWVINNLIEVTERCMQSSPVVYKDGTQKMIHDKDGDLKSAWTFDSSGANRALELLGKHKAMWIDNLNLNQSNSPYNEWLNKTKDAK